MALYYNPRHVWENSVMICWWWLNESMPTYTMHPSILSSSIVLFVGFAHQTLEYSKLSKLATHQNILWEFFKLCARDEQGLDRYLEDVLADQLSHNSDEDSKMNMKKLILQNQYSRHWHVTLWVLRQWSRPVSHSLGTLILIAALNYAILIWC